MSDNPRPVLYGSGYEAFLPRAPGAPRPLPCPGRRQALRVGRRASSPTPGCPADLAVGDVLATPVTGAYGYSMASNYNKVPRPPSCSSRGGAARVVVRRETVEDLLAPRRPEAPAVL